MGASDIDRLVRKLHNAETLDAAHMAGDAIRNAFEDQAAKLERFIALADELEGEALTKARTDEGYCINGAYQFCAKRIREILEET